MAKKSLYVFLTGILGMLLFLMIHRIVIFFYLYLLAGGYVNGGNSYYTLLLWDTFSLIIVMMLGGWYGVWLGLYWYEKVYEEKSHGGFVHHLANKVFFRGAPKTAEAKMVAVKERLESDLWELEDLSKTSAADTMAEVQAIKRVVTRKRAPRKLNGLK